MRADLFIRTVACARSYTHTSHADVSCAGLGYLCCLFTWGPVWVRLGAFQEVSGYSKSVASYRLSKLEEQGYIDMTRLITRDNDLRHVWIAPKKSALSLVEGYLKSLPSHGVKTDPADRLAEAACALSVSLSVAEEVLLSAYLWGFDGLPALLKLPQYKISRAITSLEEKGFLARSHSLADGRKFDYTILPEGLKRASEIHRLIENLGFGRLQAVVVEYPEYFMFR